MERTKGKKISVNEQKIHDLSALVSRMNLASKLGYQFDGERNLYRALGYPAGELKFDDFFAR